MGLWSKIVFYLKIRQNFSSLSWKSLIMGLNFQSVFSILLNLKEMLLITHQTHLFSEAHSVFVFAVSGEIRSSIMAIAGLASALGVVRSIRMWTFVNPILLNMLGSVLNWVLWLPRWWHVQHICYWRLFSCAEHIHFLWNLWNVFVRSRHIIVLSLFY